MTVMSKRDISVSIVEADYHRNGVGGAPFYAILFDDSDAGRMVASLFQEPGHCAVYHVEELSKGNVAFARGNSWRGDRYESQLRPLLSDYLKAHGEPEAFA